MTSVKIKLKVLLGLFFLIANAAHSENWVIYRDKKGTKIGWSVEQDGQTIYFNKVGTKVGSATIDNPEPNLLEYYGGTYDGVPIFPKLQVPLKQQPQDYGEPKFGR